MRVIIVIQLLVMCVAGDYYLRRRDLVRAELRHALGGNVPLSRAEQRVNTCLKNLKRQELEYAYDNPQYFNFSHHYFDYKDTMRDSKVYKIIQRMPKGAALHLHDLALLGPDYMLNVTYMENLYLCIAHENIVFKFSDRLPTDDCPAWRLVSDMRRACNNVTAFDEDLRRRFTVVVADPGAASRTVDDSWAALLAYFRVVRPLLTHRPLWEQYFYDALRRFREDNVMYLEVRTALMPLYELNGTLHEPQRVAKIYENIIRRFVEDYPDFVGTKIILATSWTDPLVIAEYIKLAKKLKVAVPEIFAGFDLVGREDERPPLAASAPLLRAARDLNFFFHAGETDWYGATSDDNLYDAVLLGAKRIGHGYALVKHPLLMKAVVDNGIAVEVNVISNVVLSLVRDVRNHPLSIFVANGLPVVLSSDDPGAWEAAPLTDDYYVAFMAAASRRADLRLLKTLALNSLKYSALDPPKIDDALRKFDLKWSKFVSKFACSEI